MIAGMVAHTNTMRPSGGTTGAAAPNPKTSLKPACAADAFSAAYAFPLALRSVSHCACKKCAQVVRWRRSPSGNANKRCNTARASPRSGGSATKCRSASSVSRNSAGNDVGKVNCRSGSPVGPAPGATSVRSCNPFRKTV